MDDYYKVVSVYAYDDSISRTPDARLVGDFGISLGQTHFRIQYCLTLS